MHTIWQLFLFLLWQMQTLPTEQWISPDHPNLGYIGRFNWENPKQPLCGWTGSQISLTFEGTQCKVRLADYAQDKDHKGKMYQNYIQISIDQQAPQVIALKAGEHTYTLARKLPQGKHTVVIFKRTEASIGEIGFLGFTLDSQAKVLPNEHTFSRSIEFIGDSITCGYGNEGKTADSPFAATTENGAMSYAAITARNLKAAYTAICYSGRGVYQNYDKSKEGTLRELYLQTHPKPQKLWAFNIPSPDAICINLGTNDFAHTIPDSAAFVQQYTALLQLIAQKHPLKPISCLAGPMLTGEKLKTLKAYIHAAIERQKKTGITNIYFFELSTQGKWGYGSHYHPNIAQHQQNAAELTQFIQQTLQW